jgi:phosphoglucomutase
MTIHFGTDGWRAVMSDTFTFTNLRLVAQAIADAVASPEWINGTKLEVNPDPRKMVVGFDTRFLSDRYATEVARVLAGNGFTVLLAQADGPHPGHLTRSAREQRHRRGDDHRLAQCPALQWGKTQISVRRISATGTMPAGRDLPE